MAKMCERCGKQPATVLYTDIREGKVSHYHLCPECARKMGMQPAGEPQFAISNLLAGMLDEVEEGTSSTAAGPCGNCGLSYEEFREVGRLGCPECYESFEASLRPLLRRIHGGQRHEGRVPASHARRVEEKREVRRLQDLLQKAVEEEDFEKAAEIRDQIRDLEKAAGRPVEE